MTGSILNIRHSVPWLPEGLIKGDRSKGLGATDIAAICGLSPWRTPFDVWLEKKGDNPVSQQTEWQEWGLRLEPLIASAYSDKSGQKIVKIGVTLADSKRPWHLGSPDYLCVDKPRGIDCKNIGFKDSEWGEAGSDQIPMYYILQAQWYLSLMKAKSWDFPVLFGNRQYEVFTVEHNEKLAASLFERAEEFWATYVLGDKQPEIEDSPKVRAWIKSKFPRHLHPLRKATEKESFTAIRLNALKKQIKDMEEEKADFEAQIKLAIGEDEGLELPQGKVTWKANKDGEKTDWEAMFRVASINLNSSQLSDLHKKYTKPTQGARVLRVSIKEQS